MVAGVMNRNQNKNYAIYKNRTEFIVGQNFCRTKFSSPRQNFVNFVRQIFVRYAVIHTDLYAIILDYLFSGVTNGNK